MLVCTQEENQLNSTLASPVRGDSTLVCREKIGSLNRGLTVARMNAQPFLTLGKCNLSNFQRLFQPTVLCLHACASLNDDTP